MIRKILVSPGFGAGWTTWESDPDVKALMLTYQPIIEAIERNEDVAQGLRYDNEDEEELHPAVKQLIADCRATGKDKPYLGGLRGIQVVTVTGGVRIHEYDGSESVEEQGAFTEWL